MLCVSFFLITYITLHHKENLLFLIELTQIKYFFEKSKQFSSSDEQPYDHEKMVKKIFKVNDRFLVGVEIYATHFNGTTRKINQLRLPTGIPISEIVVTGQDTFAQLQAFFNKYIKGYTAEQEVNLSSWCRSRLTEKFQTTTSTSLKSDNTGQNTPNSDEPKNLINMFDAAEMEVFSLLHHSFKRFANSPVWPVGKNYLEIKRKKKLKQ